MAESNIALDVYVIRADGYSGNWKPALKEAQELSIRLGVKVRLSYGSRKHWLIDKDTDLEPLLNEKFTIGV